MMKGLSALAKLIKYRSVAKEDKALTRNTFKVVPYIDELTDSDIGKPVRFTQVFCLQSVANPALYLASDPIKKLNSLSNIPYGRNALFVSEVKDRVRFKTSFQAN